MNKKTIAVIGLGSITTLTPLFTTAYYSQEFQNAYSWAYNKGITTMSSIDNANMQGKLTRAEMAKMISNYAKNILGKGKDTSKNCNFSDIEKAGSLKNSIIESCQLGLMGQGVASFRPTDSVSRAEFGTVLSRLLYGNQYEGGNPYYKNHLEALNRIGIIKNISNPSMKELRGYVMIMLMRTDDSNSTTNNNSTTIKNNITEGISQNNATNQETAENRNLMYKNTEFIETEQPELTEETKSLISAYQRNRTEENFLKLREEVIKNYNKVLEKKEAKLEQLERETAGGSSRSELVTEMEEYIQDMYKEYRSNINGALLRFTDSRLLSWNINEASKNKYVPVMGAGNNIYIKYTPVTYKEYKEFIDDTKYKAPLDWTNGNYPESHTDYPVVYVTYFDAVEYTKWLTEKDGKNTYRLPTETEWELAAGHMPKDAEISNGWSMPQSVYKYEGKTRGASGGIDFRGNVWEWTSTIRSEDNDIEKGRSMQSDDKYAVKGGSYGSERRECRTENREKWKINNLEQGDVGFRVIKVLNGKEPDKKADLYKLKEPTVTAKRSNNNVILSWNKVDGAYEYQIYKFDEITKSISMLERTKNTTITINSNGENERFIVQSIGLSEISGNVSPEYAVKAE